MADDEPLADLVARLSVPQKAALCLGSDFWHTAPVSEFGIEAVMLSDGPGETAGEHGSVPATCFLTASALGSSWDPDLAREVGAALGAEARTQGVAVVLGPGVNIKRSPLCGRNFEYFSEDPHLVGRMAAAVVDGLQSQQVGGCVKHFAANNQETDRMRVSADTDERTLREIYLPAFEHVVAAARPWLVMCAYNKLNGTYTSQHRWLLTELLRGEWASTAWSSPTGARCPTGSPRWPRGLTWRCRPTTGQRPREHRRGRRRNPGRGGARPRRRPGAAAGAVGTAPRASHAGRDRAPRAGPARCGADHDAAQERRRAAAH